MLDLGHTAKPVFILVLTGTGRLEEVGGVGGRAYGQTWQSMARYLRRCWAIVSRSYTGRLGIHIAKTVFRNVYFV